jgi:hypothetical protein
MVQRARCAIERRQVVKWVEHQSVGLQGPLVGRDDLPLGRNYDPVDIAFRRTKEKNWSTWRVSDAHPNTTERAAGGPVIFFRPP